jgi:hypothetical protein
MIGRFLMKLSCATSFTDNTSLLSVALAESAPYYQQFCAGVAAISMRHSEENFPSLSPHRDVHLYDDEMKCTTHALCDYLTVNRTTLSESYKTNLQRNNQTTKSLQQNSLQIPEVNISHSPSSLSSSPSLSS